MLQGMLHQHPRPARAGLQRITLGLIQEHQPARLAQLDPSAAVVKLKIIGLHRSAQRILRQSAHHAAHAHVFPHFKGALTPIRKRECFEGGGRTGFLHRPDHHRRRLPCGQGSFE